MDGSIADVEGITVGHWTDSVALTGCTVVLCPAGGVVGVDVRGSAPGTRETDLARPSMLVERAQAVLLTGGSAFGLDAAAGVVRYLYERGLGQSTPYAPVPIVPGAVIYDLGLGRPAWPDAAAGYAACESAAGNPVPQGCVGAGTGATVGKLLGMDRAVKSGIGNAAVTVGGATVAALMVVNAFGDVVASDGTRLAGPRDPGTGAYIDTSAAILAMAPSGSSGNTTIGVVATDAPLTPEGATYLARVAHDGLARSIRPVHTLVDGDTIFTLATGTGPEVSLLALGVAATLAVERAVVGAVLSATPAGGLPASGGWEETPL